MMAELGDRRRKLGVKNVHGSKSHVLYVLDALGVCVFCHCFQDSAAITNSSQCSKTTGVINFQSHFIDKIRYFQLLAEQPIELECKVISLLNVIN